MNDYVQNSDIGRAILLGYKSSKFNFEYNIGDEKRHSPKDVANKVHSLHPEIELKMGRGMVDVENAGELSHGLLNIGRAGRELGHTPKFDLKGGILEYENTVRKLKGDHSVWGLSPLQSFFWVNIHNLSSTFQGISNIGAKPKLYSWKYGKNIVNCV